MYQMRTATISRLIVPYNIWLEYISIALILLRRKKHFFIDRKTLFIQADMTLNHPDQAG